MKRFENCDSYCSLLLISYKQRDSSLTCWMTFSSVSTSKLDTPKYALKCMEYDLAATEQKRIKARAQMAVSSLKAVSKTKV